MGALVHQRNKQFKVFMGGLNSSGKTQILYKIKLGKIDFVVPTIGFNNEKIDILDIKLDVWEVGGGFMIRPLIKHYLDNIQGLIYVIRPNGGYKIEQSIKDLWDFHLKYIEIKISILFLLNKTQNEENVDLNQIQQMIKSSVPGRAIHIQHCNAVSGEGLISGIQWLAYQIKIKSGIK